jgi:uncharacterized membrane protein
MDVAGVSTAIITGTRPAPCWWPEDSQQRCDVAQSRHAQGRRHPVAMPERATITRRNAMTALVLGLVIFLGSHSVRIFADSWRNAQVARLGPNRWKMLYSIVAIAGFVLIVWGYGAARVDPVVLYAPPAWTRHLVALLMVPAFVLLAAAYVPGTRIKARIGHPMVTGTKVWAFAHLLANGNLADVVLFGSFLVWAIADYIAARRRDREAGTVYVAGPWMRDFAAVAIGLVAWAAFGFWLHVVLIGVRVS